MNSTKEITEMPAEVDFSKSAPNPYIGKARHRVTMNINGESIDYFKTESSRTGVPYQVIINMYLTDYRGQKKHLALA